MKSNHFRRWTETSDYWQGLRRGKLFSEKENNMKYIIMTPFARLVEITGFFNCVFREFLELSFYLIMQNYREPIFFEIYCIRRCRGVVLNVKATVVGSIPLWKISYFYFFTVVSNTRNTEDAMSRNLSDEHGMGCLNTSFLLLTSTTLEIQRKAKKIFLCIHVYNKVVILVCLKLIENSNKNYKKRI